MDTRTARSVLVGKRTACPDQRSGKWTLASPGIDSDHWTDCGRTTLAVHIASRYGGLSVNRRPLKGRRPGSPDGHLGLRLSTPAPRRSHDDLLSSIGIACNHLGRTTPGKSSVSHVALSSEYPRRGLRAYLDFTKSWGGGPLFP